MPRRSGPVRARARLLRWARLGTSAGQNAGGAEMKIATLGFTRTDFEVFKVEGFNERMQQIYAHVRPRLIKLGAELAPELSRKLHMEFFPHVARHARRTVNPPPE